MYEIERKGYLQGIVADYRRVLTARNSILTGAMPDLGSILHCEAEILQNYLLETIYNERGLAHVKELSIEFFKQNLPGELPFNKIQSAAQKFPAIFGRRRPADAAEHACKVLLRFKAGGYGYIQHSPLAGAQHLFSALNPLA